MSSNIEDAVSFGRPKKKNFRLRGRDGLPASDSTEQAPVSHVDDETDEPVVFKPKKAPLGNKPKSSMGLSFDEEEGETEFKLKKSNGKKKKSSFFDSSEQTFESTPTQAPKEEIYSKETIEKLKTQNAIKFVVQPLSRADKALLEEDDRLMQYLDATALVAPNEARTEEEPVEEYIVPVEEEVEDDGFRSKQIEAAKALRARLKHQDGIIQHSTEPSIIDLGPRNQVITRNTEVTTATATMDVDDEGLEVEDVSSDGEADERHALGLKYDGRHKFEDAVHKKAYDSMDYVKDHVGEGAKSTDLFGALEDDPDELAWELERIKRSGVTNQSSKSTLSTFADPIASKMSSHHHHHHHHGKNAPRIDIVSTIPPREREPLTMETILKHVEADLNGLEKVAHQHSHRLKNIKETKSEHATSLSAADDGFDKANSDLHYFEDMKVYIVDLVDCVESKLDDVGHMEHDFLQSLIKKTQRTQKGIKQAFIDEYERTRFKKGQANNTNDSTQTFWSEWRLKHQQLRSEQSSKMKQSATDYQSYNFQGDYMEDEGFSSDEETFDVKDEMEFNSQMEVLSQRAKEVFEDALEQFSQLDIILDRLYQFKSLYNVSYTQAHVSSSLKTLISPYVRLEMATWMPLKHPNWTDASWWHLIHSFSIGENNPDTKLPQEIISTVLIPRLKDAINYGWVVNRRGDTETLQLLLKGLKDWLSVKPIGDLLFLIMMNLQSAVLAVDLPRKEDGNSLALLEYGKVAFGRCLKLIHIARLWKPFFSVEVVEEIIWDKLINSKILPYLAMLPDLMSCWVALRSLVAVVGGDTVNKSSARGPGLVTFMRNKENEAMGHFEAMTVADSVLDFLKGK